MKRKTPAEVNLGEWGKNPNEEQYLCSLYDVLAMGNVRTTRNGNTRAIFAQQVRFDMGRGFPVLTTKQVMFRSMLAELIWFIEGGRETDYRMDLERLNSLMGIPAGAWNPLWSHNQKTFAAAGKAWFTGDCGVIYGSQWRNFNGEGLDQLAKIIDALKKDPFSRYHVVTAWNPLKIADMCLPPCHMKFQLFVKRPIRKGRRMRLSLAMDQRSCDMFLGVPFNIASYALLLHMIAQCVGMIPDELVVTLNDCHIYSAHLKQVRKQLGRDALKAPRLWINPEVRNIDDFTMDDVKLIDYKHQGYIPAPLL